MILMQWNEIFRKNTNVVEVWTESVVILENSSHG